MSRIVNNSILNGFALAATATMSLLLVPILIGTYGLANYGLIPLVRLLTPSGTLSLLTFGLPGLATREAARDDVLDESERLMATQSAILSIGFVIGVVVSLTMLAVGPDRLAAAFKVTSDQQGAFQWAFVVLLVVMPLLFMGMLAVNTLIGLERFLPLRFVEVASYLLYFIAASAAAMAGLPILHVIVALLVLDILKSICLLAYLYSIGSISLAAMALPRLSLMRQHIAEFGTLSLANLLSYGRRFLPSIIIPLIWGPALLGLYDAAFRIPRAFKAVQALVNNALMPRALRLDAADNAERLRSLLTRGTRLTLAFVLPPAFAAIVYADPIMAAWLGEEQRFAGIYLALLMVPWALEATISILSTASLARIDLMARLNWVYALEIGAFVAFLAALVWPLGPAAIYVAVALSAAAGYAIRVPLFTSDFGIEPATWRRLVGKITLASIAAILVVALPIQLLEVEAPWIVLGSIPIALLLSLIAVWMIWNPEERNDLAFLLRSLLDGLPWARRVLAGR